MTRRSVSYAVAAAVLAGVVSLAAACKSSTTSNNCGSGGTPPDLVGEYTLLVYVLGTATYTAPTSSGNLRIHASTYHLDAVLGTGPGTVFVLDTGNYNFVGSTCLQEFSVLDSVPPFAGSVKKNADSTIHISGNAGGMLVATTWKQVP